jgi:hypothetical protein
LRDGFFVVVRSDISRLQVLGAILSRSRCAFTGRLASRLKPLSIGILSLRKSNKAFTEAERGNECYVPRGSALLEKEHMLHLKSAADESTLTNVAWTSCYFIVPWLGGHLCRGLI